MKQLEHHRNERRSRLARLMRVAAELERVNGVHLHISSDDPEVRLDLRQVSLDAEREMAEAAAAIMEPITHVAGYTSRAKPRAKR